MTKFKIGDRVKLAPLKDPSNKPFEWDTYRHEVGIVRMVENHLVIVKFSGGYAPVYHESDLRHAATKLGKVTKGIIL